MTEKIEKIKSRILSGSLGIGRIPLDVRDKFVQYARDHYCNDYGLAFKFICDQFFDDTNKKEIIKIKERLDKLEQGE